MDHPADRTDEKNTAPRGGRDATPEHARDSKDSKDTDAHFESKEQKDAYREATGLASPAAPDLHHTRVLARTTLSYDVEYGEILGIGHPVRADAYELSVKREDGAVESIVVPRWVDESQYFYPGAYYTVALVGDYDEPDGPVSILPAHMLGSAVAPPPPEALAAKRREEEKARAEKERIEKERAGVHAAANPTPQAKPVPSSTIKR